MTPADEVLTSIPTSDALRQAEILAIRQLSDNMAMLNRSVGDLSKDMRDVRDKVIAIEAQELKAAILEVKNDVTHAVKDLRTDHEKRIADVCKDVEDLRGEGVKHGLALAKLRGTIVPLAALGSALLAGALAFISELAVHALTSGHP